MEVGDKLRDQICHRPNREQRPYNMVEAHLTSWYNVCPLRGHPLWIRSASLSVCRYQCNLRPGNDLPGTQICCEYDHTQRFLLRQQKKNIYLDPLRLVHFIIRPKRRHIGCCICFTTNDGIQLDPIRFPSLVHVQLTCLKLQRRCSFRNDLFLPLKCAAQSCGFDAFVYVHDKRKRVPSTPRPRNGQVN
jgi:hypothetical protein